MRTKILAMLGLASALVAPQALAGITFYEGNDFHGRAFTVDRTLGNFDRTGFNDRASSAVVDDGTWQVCEDAHFEGRCVVLRRGSYASLAGMGLQNRISSARPIASQAHYEYAAPPPLPQPTYEYRQRPSERIYQVPVSSVHAVVGPPEQRCWVEQQQVVQDRSSSANIPGAIVGAVIGGVLGHQVGGGRGQDIATAGGAVAGAAIGANTGHGGGQQVTTRDVQRCAQVQSQGAPDYWDVTYNFRGVDHRIQMTAPPGPTISVNGNGEPRG
jgi:uncharacterized protein YcfJ